jgi:hypothetical protein
VLRVRRFAKHHLPSTKRAKELVDAARGRRSPGGAPAPAGGPEEELISPDLRERLAELLHDDVARLRAHMPPDFDGWGLC